MTSSLRPTGSGGIQPRTNRMATKPAAMTGLLHCDLGSASSWSRAGPGLRFAPCPPEAFGLPLTSLVRRGCAPIPPAPCDQGASPGVGTVGNFWDNRTIRIATAMISSQLCPNNWVPERPAPSRSISCRSFGRTVTRTDRDWVGSVGTQHESPDLPDNAEVAGSIPASPTHPIPRLRGEPEIVSLVLFAPSQWPVATAPHTPRRRTIERCFSRSSFVISLTGTGSAMPYSSRPPDQIHGTSRCASQPIRSRKILRTRFGS
jgi:hypothetical protein